MSINSLEATNLNVISNTISGDWTEIVSLSKIAQKETEIVYLFKTVRKKNMSVQYKKEPKVPWNVFM